MNQHLAWERLCARGYGVKAAWGPADLWLGPVLRDTSEVMES